MGSGPVFACLDQKAKVIGKGLVNYSSSDIAKIKGLKTTEIEQRLEYKHSDEVIHRDNMVITKE